VSRSGSHRVTTPDGWTLDVLDLPAAAPARAVVIAGHAMMVDRRTFRPGRPGLARTLQQAGFHVLLPDLRGHGRSGPTPRRGGDWTYDQLVADSAVLLALARRLAPSLPIATLGHSLFGHTALAHLARHPDAPVAAHVALGMDVWVRANEPSPLAWLLKRGLVAASAPLAELAGCFPAARLGVGSMDEARGYWTSITRGARRGRWLGDDGLDYQALLPRVRCPCLHVVSAGDRLLGRPASALNLTATLRERTVWHLGTREHATPPALQHLRPGHMAMLTGPCEPLWQAIADWLHATLPPA
jgi:predicted alpha/beta hydrolase